MPSPLEKGHKNRFLILKSKVNHLIIKGFFEADAKAPQNPSDMELLAR